MVILRISAPLKGETYVSEFEGKKLVFQLIDVKNLKQKHEHPETHKTKYEKYYDFGAVSKKVKISNEDITKDKKLVTKNEEFPDFGCLDIDINDKSIKEAENSFFKDVTL